MCCGHIWGTLGCHVESWKQRNVRPAQCWEGELQRKLNCWNNMVDGNWYSVLHYWCCSLVLEALLCSKWYPFDWVFSGDLHCLNQHLTAEGICSREKLSVCSSDCATMWCFPCFLNLIVSSWLWRHNRDVLLITSRAAALLLSRSEWKQWYCLWSTLGWFEMESINKHYLDQAIFSLSIWVLCCRMMFGDKNLGLEW